MHVMIVDVPSSFYNPVRINVLGRVFRDGESNLDSRSHDAARRCIVFLCLGSMGDVIPLSIVAASLQRHGESSSAYLMAAVADTQRSAQPCDPSCVYTQDVTIVGS